MTQIGDDLIGQGPDVGTACVVMFRAGVHSWICKVGTVPGTMSCVEKKFEFQTRRWEEYKGTKYYDGFRDRDLVVELWLHRVPDDLSGLKFQAWDPSSGTDEKKYLGAPTPPEDLVIFLFGGLIVNPDMVLIQ